MPSVVGYFDLLLIKELVLSVDFATSKFTQSKSVTVCIVSILTGKQGK